MKVIFMAAALVLSVCSSVSFAQRGSIGRGDPDFDNDLGGAGRVRLELMLRDQEFISNQMEDTVPLKALINQQYGRVDLKNYHLKRVAVFAKSRAGQGRISLVTGQDESLAQRIDGNPRDYRVDGRFYNRYVFTAPGLETRGVWQLKLRGNIKIDRIVVVVQEIDRFPGGPGNGQSQVDFVQFSSQKNCWDLRQKVQKLVAPRQQQMACQAAATQAGGRIYRSALVVYFGGSSQCINIVDGELSQICMPVMQSIQ